MEIWLPIKNFPCYDVSSEGRVQNNKTRRILKQMTSTNGYKVLTLSKNKKPYNVRVHRLVADTFYDCDNEGLDVNHVDGDKTNNKVSNLEWCTRSKNIKHAFNTGLKQPSKRTTCKKVKVIETGKEYVSVRECARDLNVDPSRIRECLRYPTHSCFGLHIKQI